MLEDCITYVVVGISFGVVGGACRHFNLRINSLSRNLNGEEGFEWTPI
jgi:hypothetical protein